MSYANANKTAEACAGAWLDHPFGDGLNVWKVGDKIFAFIGDRQDAKMNGITLKCADADTAAMLIDVGRAKPAPYLKRGGWILIPNGTMDTGEISERICTSYQTVRASLPKKIQTTLD
jgi:predicted DNA-binding protein (MmcQ/YjbR family)